MGASVVDRGAARNPWMDFLHWHVLVCVLIM